MDSSLSLRIHNFGKLFGRQSRTLPSRIFPLYRNNFRVSVFQVKRETQCPRNNEEDHVAHLGCGEQGCEHIWNHCLYNMDTTLSLSLFWIFSGLYNHWLQMKWEWFYLKIINCSSHWVSTKYQPLRRWRPMKLYE